MASGCQMHTLFSVRVCCLIILHLTFGSVQSLKPEILMPDDNPKVSEVP